MRRIAGEIDWRRFGWLGLAAILCLCPPLLAPATPAQDKEEKKKADKDDEPKDKKSAQTERGFTLRGRFVQGVLLQRQEDLQNLAYLTFQSAGAQPNDYQVSIDWGDHSGVTRGQLLDGGLSFMVAGRHTYASAGRYSVRICVTGPNGTTVVVKSGVEVGDLFAGMLEDWTAANFPVSSPRSAADDFQATIDWGDGTPCTPGIIQRDGAVFRVNGSHSYALDGPYTVSVLLTDDSGVSLARKRVIRVVRPQVTAKFIYVRGNPNEPCLNVELVTFHVPNRLATPQEFGAIIDWGDGTPLDADATIVGSRGAFRVLGSHTYNGPGSFRIRLFLLQTWH
jgi:hypothetical protein